MALVIEYNKDRDAEKAGRTTERNRDTKREIGVRVGQFEAGFRSETHTRKVDERREDTREKVKRTFQVGFRQPEPAYAAAA